MNQDPALWAEVLAPSEQFVREQWSAVVLPHIDEELLPVANEILHHTIAAYGEPHRKYHTLDHIADCLQKLQPYSGREDYLQLFLGLLWHDVVYDTNPKQSGDSGNEELSADFAEQAMWTLGLPESAQVYDLIRSTEKHDPHNEPEALLCDIDMSILAESEGAYDAYVNAIRFEYGQYTDGQFNAGRLAALKSFSQPFHHPDFIYLNELAYENVEREIKRLSHRVL